MQYYYKEFLHYFLLLIIITFSFCSKGNDVSDETISSVKSDDILNSNPSDTNIVINNNISKNGSLIYYDEWGKYNLLRNGFIVINSNFNYIELVAQTENNRQVFFIEKSDSVSITQRGDNFELKSHKRNIPYKEANFYQEYVLDNNVKKEIIKPDFSIDANNINKDLVSRRNKIKIEYDSQIDYLKKYQDKYNLSTKFYSVWKNYFLSRMLEKKLFIIPNTEIVNKFPDWYKYEILSSLKFLDNDELLYLREYQSSARLMLIYLQLLEPDSSNRNAHSVKVEMIKSNYQGLTRDFLLLVLFESIYNQKINKSELNSIIDEILSVSGKNFYYRYVQENSLFTSYVGNDETIFNLTGELLKVEELFKKENQIIYLDFWASWCSPCIAEMPSSKKLKAEYNGRGVKFIYLSIDKIPVSWSRASKRINLNDSESYLLSNPDKSLLIRKYNIKEIPRYMIVDNKGKVLIENAPRPSDPNIKTIFDKLIPK